MGLSGPAALWIAAVSSDSICTVFGLILSSLTWLGGSCMWSDDTLSLPYMQGTDLSVWFVGRSKPSLPQSRRPLQVAIVVWVVTRPGDAARSIY